MRRFLTIGKLASFFFLGAGLTALVLSAAAYLIFTAAFRERIYPGVKVAGLNLSGLTTGTAEKRLAGAWGSLDSLEIIFSHPSATVSAAGKELGLHFDTGLMARRAFSVGRQTANPYYNFLQIAAAWRGAINLPREINLDKKPLREKLAPAAALLERPPRDAAYQFLPGAGPDRKGRVTAFRSSENGRQINYEALAANILSSVGNLAASHGPQATGPLVFALPLDIIPPAVKTSTADELGIKTLLGRGESYFYDSIPNRVYNIGLGAEKISGSLLSPGEVFSFNSAVGTVSAILGFKRAYVIKEGKTVLDDGGGVCQASTTLYRAALNAGLPVLEREAHTYRVGFYEQGGFKPGLDATVFPPRPDFRFKNDTPGWMLIQALVDKSNSRLVFDLFGTSDGRRVALSGPYVLSISPPPEPVYEDSSALPPGQVQQVDTAHPGAEVYFKREVTRGGELLISETVKSSYLPWPARYLKGTKSN